MSGVFLLDTSCEEALKNNGYWDRDGFKCCSYCGSMDPVELAKLIEQGDATMSGSDWKYGYPHKFYVKIKNPNPDKEVVVGNNRYGEIYGKKEYFEHKFYTNHLELIDIETFNKIIVFINNACGIIFKRDENGLRYLAPCYGYQKSKMGL